MKSLRTLATRAGSWWKSFRAVRLRPHLSTLVLLIPVLAVLVLANVPGWRVACTTNPWNNYLAVFVRTNYEHGWPMTYLRRRSWEDRTVSVTLSPWDLSHGIIEFRGLALTVNVVASVGILILAGVLIEARRRWRHSCFQFHLSELLAFVTLFAIGLSFYSVRRKEYTEECKIYAWLHRHDRAGDWTPDGGDWHIEGPDWLLPIVGHDRYYELFARLCSVEIMNGDDLKEAVKLRRLLRLRLWASPGQRTALIARMSTLEAIELLRHGGEQTVEIPSLPRLRALNVEYVTTSISEPLPNWKVSGIAGLKSLQSLSVQDDRFSDADLAELDGLAHLHWLSLAGTKITTAGLGHLRNLAELDWLILARTQIYDAALPTIGQIKRLSYLELSETRITDAGLESLKSLKDLHELDLNDTSVTAEGVRRLQQALPNCKIEWSPRDEESLEKGK